MNKSIRLYSAAYGSVMALAGLEHGIGEVLQGNVAPTGLMIQSWPDSAFFASLNGEPAMTVLPSLLTTGILAILLSLALLAWSLFFVQRRYGGWGLVLIAAVLLPLGGGIFPPILGVFIGLAATRIHAPLRWWRSKVSLGFRRFLAGLWPYSLAAGLLCWLAVIPGIPLLAIATGGENLAAMLVILGFVFGFMIVNWHAAKARDSLSAI